MVNIPSINRLPTAYSRLKRQDNVNLLQIEKSTPHKRRSSKDRRQRNIKVFLDRRQRSNRRRNMSDDVRHSLNAKKGTHINTVA